jgi:hypothetical protein
MFTLRFSFVLVAVFVLNAASHSAHAEYLMIYSGTTPSGWTDTTGVFGAAGTVYSGAPFSGRITFDPSNYPLYNPTNGDHYAQPYGSATPGYSNYATLNGVTVAQPDSSSFWGGTVGDPGNAGLFFYIGAWNDDFFVYFDAPSGASTYGITQLMLAASNVPNFAFTAADFSSSEVKLQDGQGGSLAPLSLSYVSLTAVPEIGLAGASSVFALLASVLGLLERRARRQVA